MIRHQDAGVQAAFVLDERITRLMQVAGIVVLAKGTGFTIVTCAAGCVEGLRRGARVDGGV
jgi:hypothetical protein